MNDVAEFNDFRIIDISYKGEYPADVLSNFAPNEFVLDGIKCTSMEGFLQSLKFKNPEKQKKVCSLAGKEAKKSRGVLPQLRWRLTKKLYWNNVEFHRFSDDYQILLDRAFDKLGENEKFANALLSTKNDILCHSVGKDDFRKTVLTAYEFITRLERLRDTRL